MGKLKITGKLLILIILFSLLIFVVKYADTIREIVLDQTIYKKTVKDVAGVKTDFEEEVKEDVSSYADQAKKQILLITISDIINNFKGMNKIKNDVSTAKDVLFKEVKNLTENDKKK